MVEIPSHERPTEEIGSGVRAARWWPGEGRAFSTVLRCASRGELSELFSATGWIRPPEPIADMSHSTFARLQPKRFIGTKLRLPVKA